MEESANCSLCQHAGAFHQGNTCGLCNKVCKFQPDLPTKPAAPTPRMRYALRGDESPPDKPAKSVVHSDYVRRPGEPIPSVLDMLIDARDGKLLLEERTKSTILNVEPSKPYVYEFMKENEFQEQVILLAEGHGWRVAHTYSRKVRGWPDLVLVRPPKMVCLELKAQRGQPSPKQNDWIDDLDDCEGVVGRVVRPSDWEEIKRLLSYSESAAYE